MGKCPVCRSAIVLPACLALFIHLAAPGAASAGSWLWKRTYNGAANMDDVGQAVAVSPDGSSIYVAGYTYVPGQDENLLLLKYDSTGALQKTLTLNGAANLSERGQGVAVAADGSVYVTGYTTMSGQGKNLLLRKYAPNGALVWKRGFNGAANKDDQGQAVAVAANGSVYVTGSTVVAGQERNLFLRKYTPAGALVWHRTYAGNGDDAGCGVAVAPDGAVYVAGYTKVAGRQSDILLRKYSASGGTVWTRTWNGPASSYDVGTAVAVSSEGDVYLSAYTYTASRSYDLLLRRYSPAGELFFSKLWDGAASHADYGAGVALSPDATNVYIVGLTWKGANDADLLLQKYAEDGSRIFSTTYNGPGTSYSNDGANAIATFMGSGFYVTGYEYVDGQGWNLLLLQYM